MSDTKRIASLEHAIRWAVKEIDENITRVDFTRKGSKAYMLLVRLRVELDTALFACPVGCVGEEDGRSRKPVAEDDDVCDLSICPACQGLKGPVGQPLCRTCNGSGKTRFVESRYID